jgi:hypothetical protein
MIMVNRDVVIKKYLEDEEIIARFNSYLEEQPDGCITWTGYTTGKGYGMFNIYYHGAVKAHRFAYALHYGIDKLPAGTDKTQKRMVVHHKCNNKACVNPLHLESVTDRFNLGIVNDKNMF